MLRQKLEENKEIGETSNKKAKIDDSFNNLGVTSAYFNKGVPKSQPDDISISIEEQILNLQKELNSAINRLDLITPPVKYVYNPLEYAFNVNETYIRKYCCSTKKILLVGMNPGPFGMCQTGIPFGDPSCVKDFLGIDGIINKPEIECPFRLVIGFNSKRREQSGVKFWNYFESVCKTADNFFKNAVLVNFCPVALMKENGTNVTPAEIKNIQVRKSLEDVCNNWYLKLLFILKPEYVIAIGTYIEKKTKDLFKANGITNIKILYMPHPSPRAVNNQNWHEKAQTFLQVNNLTQYFCD